MKKVFSYIVSIYDYESEAAMRAHLEKHPQWHIDYAEKNCNGWSAQVRIKIANENAGF